MADAQATFVATLDSSGIQSGAKSGLTALQRLGQEIQKRSKDLAALKAAQARLAQSAGVQEYLKRQKAIEASQKKAEQLERKMASAQEAVEIAKQARVAPEDLAKLAADAEKAKAAYEDVTSEIERLQKAQETLAGNDKAVEAYRDQAKVIKATEAELADLQSQYNEAGGSATDLADEIKEPTAGIQRLLEQAKGAGGPLGALAGTIQTVVQSAKTAGPLALLAVIVAIGVAAVTAAARLAKFALASADAARNSARTRSSAAFGSLGGTKEIEGAMAALRQNTAASKEEAQGLAAELYRLGDRGAQLEQTALTIERFGQLGEDAKGAVKGLYEELRRPVSAVGIAGGVAKSLVITKEMLPRDVFLELASQLGKDGNRALLQGFTAKKDDVRTALARIGEQRFAGPALEQMRSLDKLSERLHENLQILFATLKVGVLLGALQKLVEILDETSASGKAIREVLGAFAQPFADAVEGALPYLEAFLKGLVFGALIVAYAGIKIKNTLGSLIPTSLTKNIDWLSLVAAIAATAVVTLAVAFTALAAVLFVLALPFIVLVALVVLLIAGLVMLADAIVGWFDQASAALEGVDMSKAVEGILTAIVETIEDGAADIYKAFTDLAKGGLDAFKSALGIKSPSLAFRLAGREIPRGAALGVEDEAPALQDSAASMVGPEDMGSGTGTGRPRSGTITFVVQPGAVVIQGVQDAEEIADESFLRKLGRALVGAAREGGLSPEPEPA
jgi:hypothetical protein